MFVLEHHDKDGMFVHPHQVIGASEHAVKKVRRAHFRIVEFGLAALYDGYDVG